MEILNKRELQKNAIYYSSDFDFKDCTNLYKTCTTKPYSFLLNDITLPSDNPLCFKRIIFEKI